MNILVIGSTGPQGREFVAQAMGAGHAVRALARDPSALQPAPSLEVVRGNVFDPPSLDAAVHGQDAAVVILGPIPSPIARADVARFILDALRTRQYVGKTVSLGKPEKGR